MTLPGQCEHGRAAFCGQCWRAKDPRERIQCSCPRIDGKDCVRVRSNDDLREFMGGEAICSEDDECPCACHEIYEAELVDEIERNA